jgi:hypothetical protein
MEHKQSKAGEWKAWVDLMPGPSGPTLHVHGTISVYGKAHHTLEKAEPQGSNPTILLLEVLPAPSAGDVTTNLKYQEKVSDAKQYAQVQIREIEDVTVDVEEVH